MKKENLQKKANSLQAQIIGLKIFIWVSCSFLAGIISLLLPFESSNNALEKNSFSSLKIFLIYFMLYFICAGIAVILCKAVNRSSLGKEHKETQLKIEELQENELSQRKACLDFERILDNTERSPGEDSVAYLARCMREAEKDNQE